MLRAWLASSLLLAYGSAVPAGECRALLRPLLLSREPPAAELQAVRERCRAEQADGDPDAGYQLALLHLGLLDWDPERALPLIEAAAEAGIPEAEYWLAWQLETGPLLPNDPPAALRWYEAAAEHEHRLALQRLAEAYAAGELGLPRDPRRAATLRARAQHCARRQGG